MSKPEYHLTRRWVAIPKKKGWQPGYGETPENAYRSALARQRGRNQARDGARMERKRDLADKDALSKLAHRQSEELCRAVSREKELREEVRRLNDRARRNEAEAAACARLKPIIDSLAEDKWILTLLAATGLADNSIQQAIVAGIYPEGLDQGRFAGAIDAIERMREAIGK